MSRFPFAFVIGMAAGAFSIGTPAALSFFKLRAELVQVTRERDAAWEMYRILADEKNILEAK